MPSSYAFDYEFARAQHGLGCRAATRVVVPDVIPQDRLDRIGARARKVRRYPGLKEEYYLHGLRSPTPPSSTDSESTGRASSPSCARRPTSRSTTGTGTRSSPACSSDSARDPAVHAVVLPRTPEQREAIRDAALAVARSCPTGRSTR